MKQQRTTQRTLSLFFFCLLFVLATQVNAQTVTIRPDNGSMIPVVNDSYSETGFANGGFSFWQHEQLPLTMVASDKPTLTTDGQLNSHASNFYSANGGFQVVGGQTDDGLMTIALPHGYRFTGYRIVVQNNVNMVGGNNGLPIGHSKEMYFGETTSDYEYRSGFYASMGVAVNNNEYVVERTSTVPGDMGNVLYFKVGNNLTGTVLSTSRQYVACFLKHIEISYTTEASFPVSLVPTEENISGVSYTTFGFLTGKGDLGEVNYRSYGGGLFGWGATRRQSYLYSNFKDAEAKMWLYEEANVDNGVAGSSKGNRSITQEAIGSSSNSTYWYGVKSGNTYYIESPVSFDNANKTAMPLAYRIVGATINYNLKNNAAYYLDVYAPDGKSVEQTIKVESAGSYTIQGKLNNDAVKFAVRPLEEGQTAQGYVTASVSMQALDPFVNSMTITAKVKNNPAIRASADYTATDFAVGGGNLSMSMPAEYVGQPVVFSFENLASHYGDETYPGGNEAYHSRFNFVRSPYYDLFGLTNNNIYNAVEEAMNHDYRDKVTVDVAGNQLFKFNNAADIQKATASTGRQYFEEYPFSLESYAAAGGSFGQVEMTVSAGEQSSKEVFLIVSDEPRYNIAPTSSWQHRSNAFYYTTIALSTTSYEPTVKFTKVYDKAFVGSGEDTKGYYGVTVRAADKDGNLGYCSVGDVLTKLNAALADETLAEKPADLAHLLYVDMGTEMAGVYNSSDEEWDLLKNGLAKNALVFLPVNTTRRADNFAERLAGGAKPVFRAAANIVITDKEPFYTPYQVVVDAANKATYTRNRSGNNNTVRNATVMLPFTMTLREGRHTNVDNDCAFDVYTMEPEECLVVTEWDQDYANAAKFRRVTRGRTEANVPYMLRVDEGYEQPDNVSFIAEEYGAYIMPTTGHHGNTYLTGETATGQIQGAEYTFEHRGSYCGERVTSPVFYFSNNLFMSTEFFPEGERYMNGRPFRTYYSYTATGAQSDMLSFRPVFDDDFIPTAVDGVVEKDASDLSITTARGSVTLRARTARQLTIYHLSGLVVRHVSLRAGEEQTVQLAAGVYVINGKKVIIN